MKVGGMFNRPWTARVWIMMGVALLSLALIPWMGSRTIAQTPARPDASNGRYLFADLAERVLPSVVTVYVKRDMRKEMDPQTLERLKQFQRQFEDPLLRQFMPGIPQMPGTPGAPKQEGDEDDWITKGSGSGVIVSTDGYIVTNWHVVGEKKNNPEIRIVLYDNTELTGKDIQVVESSQLADLALLKINRPGLKPLSWGDSEKLRIGEWVAAVGSPLDLRMTVTQGIICAKHREIDAGGGMGSMLQTDAVINPGSSGGALVNMDGQLIGINRLITTPFQGREAWSGYGFAIPANDARQFVETVIRDGKITYGYIGVGVANEFQDSEKLRNALGLTKDQKGALVMNVNPGTPAFEAGLQEGDLIVSADNKTVTNYNDLVGYVAMRSVGTVVKLTVLRPEEGGKPKRMTLQVKVAERPSKEDLDRTLRGGGPAPVKPKPQVREQNDLGVRVEPYNESGRHGLRITEVAPGSPAARAGLSPGDVLVEINHLPLRTAQDLNKALKLRQGQGQPHLLKYLHEGQQGLIAIDTNGTREKAGD